MSTCPTEEDIERFLEGTLSERRAQVVDAHLRDCASCGALLETDDDSERLVSGLRLAHERHEETRAPEAAPLELGRYRILRRIGAGAMGIVYEAEQRNPRRRVALKVAQPRMLSEQGLWRFEHEARVLARLEHPGIARIYEAGTTDLGGPQPFFAMELVQGRPLLDHAREAELDRRARLELFARICEGVEYAHQRGVLHRDLKPSNILVTPEGQPKILDFGVARTLDPDAAARTLQTQVGQIVGTLPYMSPEQVRGDPSAIDIRADVYALGVILFQMLSGRLPHDVDGKAPSVAVRVVSEEEPSSLTAAGVAADTDLETIAGMALARDVERRYPSAAALADDVRRYLDDLPIAARPPSRGYLVRKFVRRHRGLVAATGLLFAVLVTGIVGIALQASRARDAELDAKRKNRETLRALARSEAVKDLFLRKLLRMADPESGGRPRDYTVRQALDDIAEGLDGAFPDQPDVEAEVRVTLGNAYRALGFLDKARPHLERALVLRRRTFGEHSHEVAQALNVLGVHCAAQGDHRAAAGHFRSALALYLELLGDEHAHVATALHNLGSALSVLGSHAEATAAVERAVRMHERLAEQPHPALAGAVAELAHLRFEEGRYEDAEDLQRRSLAIRERIQGPDHPATAQAQAQLGWLLAQRGQLAEAEGLCRQALETCLRVLPEDHLSVASARFELARVLHRKRDLDTAEELVRQVLALERRWLGDHPQVATTLHALGDIVMASGDPEQAAGIFEEALELRERFSDEGHPSMAITRVGLARALLAAGRRQHAEDAFAEVGDLLAPSHRNAAAWACHYLRALARGLERESSYRRAKEARLRALALSEHLWGRTHARTIVARSRVAVTHIFLQEHDAAEAAWRQVLDELDDRDERVRLRVLGNLALVHRCRGELAEAERLGVDVLEGLRKVVGSTSTDSSVGIALGNLGRTVHLGGDLERAERLLRQGLELLEADSGAGDVKTAMVRKNLAALYLDRGRVQEAEPLVRRSLADLGARFPPANHRVAEVEALLGRCLAERDAGEAERLLLAAHRKLERSLGRSAPQTLEAAESLARLYASQGRDEDASAWRRRGPTDGTRHR